MIDWRWLIPLSLLVGASIGWSLCQQRMRALCVRCQRGLKMDEWEGAALVDRGTIPPPSLPLPSSAEAQELARLRELVPEAWLVRWAAGMLAYLIRTQPTDNDTIALEWVQRLYALATRIEAAGTGAESVAPAWEQTPTWRE